MRIEYDPTHDLLNIEFIYGEAITLIERKLRMPLVRSRLTGEIQGVQG
jgi:hypothetical protein